jgi:hypothetical protein
MSTKLMSLEARQLAREPAFKQFIYIRTSGETVKQKHVVLQIGVHGPKKNIT